MKISFIIYIMFRGLGSRRKATPIACTLHEKEQGTLLVHKWMFSILYIQEQECYCTNGCAAFYIYKSKNRKLEYKTSSQMTKGKTKAPLFFFLIVWQRKVGLPGRFAVVIYTHFAICRSKQRDRGRRMVIVKVQQAVVHYILHFPLKL